MADLEANMMHFQLMHESLARFSESFASFLYGLNMNAFCVDFPEVALILLLIRWVYAPG
jgi:DASH complex subunit DAM1